jgi:hypothetical protein
MTFRPINKLGLNRIFYINNSIIDARTREEEKIELGET